jgi:hypothetical protein
MVLYWMGILRALETGEVSRAELILEHGICERTLRRYLARARAKRDELESGDRSPDIDDAPILHLTSRSGSHARRGGWYSMDDDTTSHDDVGGPVLVSNRQGTGLKRQRLGTGKPVDGRLRHHRPGKLAGGKT